LSPEQFKPTFRDVLEHIHPDDISPFEEAVAGCVRDGAPFSCEYRVLRSDGTELTVLARGTRTDDAGGAASTLYGTVQDITERKQAEAALLLIERYLTQETSTSRGTGRHAALSLRSGTDVSLGANAVMTGSTSAIVLVATDPLSRQE
jgi:hypothetical protein